MWKHSKKWIIESSVALLFLVIPSILFFTDSITIKIDSNVVLFFVLIVFLSFQPISLVLSILDYMQCLI